jgi:GNAT superfamily N-acetyltransferase
LSLDSGLTSRLLRGLEAEGLIEVEPDAGDGRRRIARPTARGLAEIAEYERISDERAASILDRHGGGTRALLLEAMARVACVLNADRIAIVDEDPETPDALACLAGYYADLARLFPEGFEPALSLDPDRPALRPPLGGFLVARADGLAVGCCALKGDGGGTGEIKRLWVAPPARGLGLARALMAAAEARARGLGMRRLRLDTNRALTAAIRLYRATGWHEVPAFNAEPYAHHWFEKPLA